MSVNKKRHILYACLTFILLLVLLCYFSDGVDVLFPTNVLHSSLSNKPAATGNSRNTYNKSGYGIIYTGNLELFPPIYVSISTLNYLNFTSYPIEIFVNGNNYELTISKCEKYFVYSFIANLTINCLFINNTLAKSKYSFKILALLHTSFQHALFLDDDNILIQSPNILFSSDQYLTNHAIFWPDLWGKNCAGLFFEDCISVLMLLRQRVICNDILYAACLDTNDIYVRHIINITYNESDLKYTQSQESGQLLVDTALYYDVLQAVFECSESIKYQYYLYFDKDCFRLMWLEKQKAFYYTDIMPQYAGFVKGNTFDATALFQFWDNSNNVMFIHQTKWVNPMNHSLWPYYQQMANKWQCADNWGHGDVQPIHNEYEIKQTINNKYNGKLIADLESKWKQFWVDTQNMSYILINER